jgi:hypothetical protein
MEDSGLIDVALNVPLKKEASELTAIFTAIGKTMKANKLNSRLK